MKMSANIADFTILDNLELKDAVVNFCQNSDHGFPEVDEFEN